MKIIPPVEIMPNVKITMNQAQRFNHPFKNHPFNKVRHIGLIWAALAVITILLVTVLLVTVIPSKASANDAPLSTIETIPDTALIMVTSPSCPWCDAFEEEVGVIYGKTSESALFPIHRLDYFTKFTGHLGHITAANVTPTFIIIRDFQEIGRLEGYPGDEMFWWRFSEYTQE